MVRSNGDKYDIDELYEFADHTGILERHRQLLAKPFHENQVLQLFSQDNIKSFQVDMKIMYYELIKMLIEYERNKQPEVRNTKSLSAKQSPCLFESQGTTPPFFIF